MKLLKYSIFFSLLFPSIFSIGQVAVTNQNIIQVQEVFVPVTDPVSLATLPVDQTQISRKYLDGFGRPIQNVIMKGSPNQKDIVQNFEYDVFGREVKSYLPYVSTNSDANFNSNWASAQALFYNNNDNNADRIATDVVPFATMKIEASPLNRLSEQIGVGQAWNGTTAKSVKYDYRPNSNSAPDIDNVLWWVYDEVTGNGVINSASRYYSDNSLFLTITTDEEGRKSFAYRNKSGQVVLDRTPESATTYLDTYYIYDKFGNLVIKVPPAAIKSVLTNNYTSTASVPNLLYSYKFDHRQRMIYKKAPDANAGTNYIYDRLDRLVLAQDYEYGKPMWLYTKYDGLNRPILKGIYTHTNNFNNEATMAELQLLVDSYGLNEMRNSAGTHGYTENLSFPNDPSKCEVLSVNYYDDYNFNGDASNVPDYAYNATAGPVGQATQANNNTIGLATGVKTKILGTNNYLISVSFYDDRGRGIQTQSNNSLNLNQASLPDVSTQVLDFVGKITYGKIVHTSGVSPQIIIQKRNNYDHAGRLTKTWQRNNTDPEVLLSEAKYNELGQPVEKNLHSENSGTSFFTISRLHLQHSRSTHPYQQSSIKRRGCGQQ